MTPLHQQWSYISLVSTNWCLNARESYTSVDHCEINSGGWIQKQGFLKIFIVGHQRRTQSEDWAICFNSLWPSDSMSHYRTWSALVQAMAWCLMAPSHYLNQCWPSVRSSDIYLGAISLKISQPKKLPVVWKLLLWNFIQISQGPMSKLTLCIFAFRYTTGISSQQGPPCLQPPVCVQPS